MKTLTTLCTLLILTAAEAFAMTLRREWERTWKLVSDPGGRPEDA